MSAAPLVLTTKGLEDYALVDSGHGRKLERFGALLLDRPEEQAIWTPRLPRAEWEKADAIFTGDVDEEGAGRWKRRAGVGEAWTCKHGAIRYECRFTSFRHVGAFPEQEAHFSFMRERLSKAGGDAVAPEPLRLYRACLARRGGGGRGGDACRRLEEGDRLGAREPGAFRALATGRSAGSSTTRRSSPRARSGAGGAMTASCSTRRNSAAGRRARSGSSSRDLPDMLRLCRDLVKPDGFLILTAYAIRASFLSLHRVTEEVFGAGVESGELALEDSGGGLLATSLFSRWSAP